MMLTANFTFWLPYLILAFLVLVALWGVWRLRRRRKPIEDAGMLYTPLDQTTGRWGRRQQGVTVKRLRQWLHTHLTDDISAWYEKLAKDQAKSVLDDLQDFSERSGFDLALLLDDRYADHVKLDEALREAVTRFLLARASMSDLNADLVTYTRYQQVLSGEAKAGQIHQLYAQLVYRELAPPADPRILAASDRERAQHQLEAIRTSAQRDWEAFVPVLNEVMSAKIPSRRANHQRTSDMPPADKASAPA